MAEHKPESKRALAGSSIKVKRGSAAQVDSELEHDREEVDFVLFRSSSRPGW